MSDDVARAVQFMRRYSMGWNRFGDSANAVTADQAAETLRKFNEQAPLIRRMWSRLNV